MRTLTIYVAEDGSRFDEEAECRAYDDLCAAVAEAMAPLGPDDRPRGHTYRQHDIAACQSVKATMRRIVERVLGPHYSEFYGRPDSEISPMGIYGRLIDDCVRAECVRRAWGRLCCVNFDLGREYEQPYYALHPSQATTPFEPGGPRAS